MTKRAVEGTAIQGGAQEQSDRRRKRWMSDRCPPMLQATPVRLSPTVTFLISSPAPRA